MKKLVLCLIVLMGVISCSRNTSNMQFQTVLPNGKTVVITHSTTTNGNGKILQSREKRDTI